METAVMSEEVVQALQEISSGTVKIPMPVIIALACVIVALYIIQCILVGALARSKGYSFFGNFLLGLFFGVFALIYEAGRPVSYERECVMQDRLALQTAKELYKLQRAREKSQTASIPKVPVK